MNRAPAPGTLATLPALLLERARDTPDVDALRHHHLGIWTALTWTALASEVRTIGIGLDSLDVNEGDVVGLIASNQPLWIASDLAIQGLGAVALAIDPSFSPGTVVTLLQTHGASSVIVGDQEQYDKVMESLNLLPLLRRVVVIEPRGIAALATDPTASVEIDGRVVTTMAAVHKAATGLPDLWTSRAASLDPAATCTVEAHLDRSTQPPNLRAHTANSRDLLEAGDNLVKRLEAHGGDELYPVASLADPVERALSIALMLRVGAVVNIGEGGLLQRLEVRAVQPTIAHLPAGHLRSIRDDVVRRRAKRGLRKFAVDRLLNGSGDRSVSALTDRRITFGLLSLLGIAALVVHRLLLEQHGLIRLGIITALAALVLFVLVVGGFGVRPFIRRAYGLSSAHSLLTSPDLDQETRSFLGALHLAPIIEQRHPTAGVTVAPHH